MTAVAFKNELISKISGIKDKGRLRSIKNFVEMECDIFHPNGAITLNPEMIKILEISEKDYKNGQYTPHEQVMAEMDIWLRERA